MEQFLNEVEYQFEKHAAKKGKLMPSIRDRAEDLYLYQLNFA
jgi:DNA-binding transcriptional regulator YhcF (GntR family)